jgi:hypothetical protein
MGVISSKFIRFFTTGITADGSITDVRSSSGKSISDRMKTDFDTFFSLHGKIPTYDHERERFTNFVIGVMIIEQSSGFKGEKITRRGYSGVKFKNDQKDETQKKNGRFSLSNVGGNYSKLPKIIENTKTVLNVKSKDNMCFVWAILAHLFPVESNKCIISSYRSKFKLINTESLEFPVRLGMISEFCQSNKLNIRVWGLDLNSNHIFIIVETIEFTPFDVINLLLYDGHFSLIKKIDALVSFVIGSRVMICDYCGNCKFYSAFALEKHINICVKFDGEEVIRLSNKKTLKFRNFNKMQRVPGVIYADFESILKPVNEEKKVTVLIAKHVPIAYGAAYVLGDVIEESYGNGENCVDDFISFVLDVAKRHKNIYDMIKSEGSLNIEADCVLCGMGASFCKMVRDLSNGNEIGFAHQKCAKNYYDKLLNLPVLFHNLKGYDSHLFIDKLVARTRFFTCIPLSREKYISFECVSHEGIKIRFLDSMGFLQGSLSSLSDKLKEFKFIGSDKGNMDLKKLVGLDSKLPFPYEYITSEEVLNETELPICNKKWFSRLKDKSPEQSEIDSARATFKKYECKSILDYMMLYLRIDTLLLVEIFESFRLMTANDTKLDPLNYYTTPGMAWDAALLKSKQSLEILSDYNIINFFIEKGSIRGGISTPSELKYHEIKNTSIHYFDVTNLYGYAMTFPLPYGGFKYIDKITMEECFKLLESWNVFSNWGYMFEVDVIYPENLKILHNSLPFMVENVNGKLVPIARDKLNYKCHIIILKQAIENGLVLKRVHSAIYFKQTPFLKNYVMGNTQKRGETNDENMRNYYKLMNNAVYGKTMENILNRSAMKIVDVKDEKKITKITSSENILDVNVLTQNLMLYSCKKQPPVFDKPIYVGFTILEISKYHMYNLLYSKIKKKWPTSQLMYMDTDSLIVKMDEEKIDYNGIEESFDLSAYKDNRKRNENKGVLGTLKDEYPNDKISRFVCLKSKCYALVTESGKLYMKNKGISLMRDTSFEDYVRMLECEIKGEDSSIKIEQFSFRSINHNVFTVKTMKTALKSKDDKRKPANKEYKTLPLTD